ncbi:hypothetical protein DERP_013202 [Dermatophagoides pteronyssinus]|uniref:Uncharacterized protein n=1 Tax=Dermatophagoides pteronyssinus TaxID=6956 RepID=A0ABQ8J3R1_DERPT|nr:hypothetical protein DERP_013202 [Dermatophagoides pteronyssinus]
MFLLFNDYYFDDAREKNSLNSCKTRWQKRFASDFFILAMSFIDNHNNNMHTTIDWLAVFCYHHRDSIEHPSSSSFVDCQASLSKQQQQKKSNQNFLFSGTSSSLISRIVQ